MTSARAHLRMAARRSPDGSLADILRETNRHLARDVQDTGRFMTLFYLRIDPAARTLRWVRAGHPPAAAFTPATGAFTELRGEGVALGMTASAAYAENTLPVPPGGMVIAVGTDGIWEAADPAGSFYGRRRFLEVVRRSAGGSAREILDAVFGDLRRFSLGTVPTDDITLVIVKADPDGSGVRDFQI
jgi:sigma-B regulation protein RsbU (phosphoserine phosphatase)